MRRRTKAAIILVFVFALFVFLVPIVPVPLNLCVPHANCLPIQVRDPATVSISFYILGVGGRILTPSSSGENTFQILFWPGWVCNRAIASDGGVIITCNQVMWSS